MPRSASVSGSLVVVPERFGRPAGALLALPGDARDPADAVPRGPDRRRVVVALALWLSDRRVEAALLGVLAAGPAILVAGWAFTRPALVEDGATQADRVSDGRLLGVLIVIGAAAVLALVALVPADRLVAPRRRDVVRGLVGAVALVAVVGALGLVASVGNPFTWAADQIGGSGEVANGPGRLGSLETNNRTVWWGEAWQVFRAHPAGGTGARTFEIARKRYRDDAPNVTEPHSLPLQLLSDTGLPAFLSVSRSSSGSASGSARACDGSSPDERAAAVGLVALPLAFGLHSLVDYDLDFLAVAAPTALVSAALLAAGRPARRRAQPGARAGGRASSQRSPRSGSSWHRRSPPASVDRAYRQSDAGDLARRGVSRDGRRASTRSRPSRSSPAPTIASLAGDNARGRDVLRAGDAPPAGEPRDLVGARRLPPARARQPVQRLLRLQRRVHARSEEQPFYAGGPLDRRRPR